MSQTKAQLIDNLVQPITGALGSASAPTFSFTADPNTGMYSPGADQLALSTGGTGRLFVDASGNLGIGQTPVATLTVKSNTAFTVDLLGEASGNTSQIRFVNNAYNAVYGSIRHTGTTLNVTNTLSDSLVLSTANTERARIDSSGRLLVGTSSARTWAGLEHSLQIETISYIRSGILQINGGNDTIGALMTLGKTRGATAGANTIVQNNDLLGRIYFVGADGSALVQGATIQAEVDGTPGTNDMPGRLVFSTTADGASSPTERMRIASDGRVTIKGTVFQENSQYNFNSSDSSISFVNRDSSGAKTFSWYVGASGGSPVATLSTAGVWTNASDVKNKENIEDIAYGIETIKALLPRQYDVKSNGKHAIGFVAQEVQPIIPELVHESFIETIQETHLGLDYGSMTAVLTKALQEAITKIETLEAKVAALEAA